jgi:hypothetical protein
MAVPPKSQRAKQEPVTAVAAFPPLTLDRLDKMGTTKVAVFRDHDGQVHNVSTHDNLFSLHGYRYLQGLAYRTTGQLYWDEEIEQEFQMGTRWTTIEGLWFKKLQDAYVNGQPIPF